VTDLIPTLAGTLITLATATVPFTFGSLAYSLLADLIRHWRHNR
jgi:hypothetical protein